MSVRLYGRALGNGSLAVVTAGFHQALTSAGLLEGFYPLDKSGGSEEDDSPPGALASDAVFTGNLSLIPRMVQGARHERHWVQVTPNSTHIPFKLLAAVLDLKNPHIISASSWGTGVIRRTLEDMGVSTPPPIVTVGHGISGFAPDSDQLAKTRQDYAAERFRVVHFSTTDGQRKGTVELVQAWNLATHQLPSGAELVLVLDYHARSALMDRLLDQLTGLPPSVRIMPRGDLSAAQMSSFLCQHHVVCTPSRGEGFGLLPLQARACGVPVLTTATTGHSAGHCRGPGVMRIPQSEVLAPIDDGPGALAPMVDPEKIAVALSVLYQAWNGISLLTEAHAERVINEWSWESQLEPLMYQLKHDGEPA